MINNNDNWSELAGLAQKGDKSAYSSLLKSLIPYIGNFLAGKLNNADAIEDITQEVLVSVHKSLHTYSPDLKFKPWLISIINFRKADYLRRYYRKRRNVEVGLENIEFQKQYVTKTEYAGEYIDVEKALSRLPEKQRHIFELVKIHGYTAQEAADETGMSVSAVKVSVHRAQKKMAFKKEVTK